MKGALPLSIIGLILLLLGREGVLSRDFTGNDIRAFRIPQTSARDLKLSATVYTNFSNTHIFGISKQKQTRIHGHLRLQYSRFYENERLQWDFNAREQLSIYHINLDTRQYPGNVDYRENSEKGSENYQQQFSLQNFLAWYPIPISAFLYHRLSANLLWNKSIHRAMEQRFFRGDDSEGRLQREKEEKLVDVDGMIGLGIGRVRNGSTAYLAYRISQRLEEERSLQRPLTAEEIHHVAIMLYRYREDLTDHERAAKYFFPELYRYLFENNILNQRRSPTYIVFKLLEVLREPMARRFHGWRIYSGAGPFGSYTRVATQWSNENEREGDVAFRRGIHALFQLGGAVFYPVSNKLQVNVIQQVDFHNMAFPNQYLWQGVLQVAYELTEMIDLIGAVGFYQFHRKAPSPLYLEEALPSLPPFYQYYGYRFGADYFVPQPIPFGIFDQPFIGNRQRIIPAELSFRFFIEDRITLQVSATYRYWEIVHQHIFRSLGIRSELYINII